MKTAKHYIKPGQIVEGTFKIGDNIFPLGEQPDGSIIFKENNKVYRGFMLCKGYAVASVNAE